MSDDDFDLFADEMGKVQPLKGQKPRIQAKKEKNKHDMFNGIEQSVYAAQVAQHTGEVTVKQSMDGQLFSRGVSHKDLKRLAQLVIAAEDTLDLHHHTEAEAIRALVDFMAQALLDEVRYVSVIHGRGLHSGGKPILKSATYHWLEHGEFAASVLAAVPTKDSQGGASNLLLKRKKKDRED